LDKVKADILFEMSQVILWIQTGQMVTLKSNWINGRLEMAKN
jgi:hypothetical protein